jgi:ParB family chromosome partitioning protein
MAGRGRLKPVVQDDAPPVVEDPAAAVLEWLPVSGLKLCEGNVRRGSKGDLDQLAADILAHGLIQNLVGRRDGDGSVRIIAGGRRLRAMQQLVKRQLWEGDARVAVLVLDDGDVAREAGLAENFQRLPMTAADEVQAFAAVVAGGADVPDVARRFGVTERIVRQRLRLAQLAPVVMEALAKGKISLDVAQAFAAVPDAARQAKVFKEASGYDLGSAGSIRRLMQRSGYDATHARAVFVGREEYVAHGGSFAVDLFAEADAEHWLDEAIVDRLAGEKLRVEAGALQARFGFAAVIPMMKWDDAAALVEDLEIAKQWTDFTQMPAEDRARMVVLADIGPSGEARVRDKQAYWASGAAPIVAAVPASSVRDAVAQDPTPAAVDEEEAGEVVKPVPGALRDALAMRRRDALALALLDPDHAGDAAALLVFTVLESIGQHGDSGARGSCIQALPHDRNEPVKDALPWAGDALATAVAAMRDGFDWSWRDGKTAVARWQAFRLVPADQHERFAQVAITATLRAWGENGARTPPAVLADVGRLLDSDRVMRGHWRPTAANYFDRCGKGQCLAFVEACAGAADFPGLAVWAKLKKAELAALCEQLAAGDKGPLMAVLKAGDDNHLVRRISAKCAAWLPADAMFGEVVG